MTLDLDNLERLARAALDAGIRPTYHVSPSGAVNAYNTFALALDPQTTLALLARLRAAERLFDERLARAIHETKGGGPFGREGECECTEDADAIAATYRKLERAALTETPE